MDATLLRALIVDGGNLFLRFVTSRPAKREESTNLESPEEAFHRIYGQASPESQTSPEPTVLQELKLRAAQKAMEVVDEELKKRPVITKRDVSIVCLICGHHHIVTASAALGEALRFARKDGIGVPEVQRRLEIAAEECDIAERIDFSPAQLEKSAPAEREFLKGFIPRLRELRHQNDTISTVDDLEKAATMAQKLATEYRTKERELR